MPMNTTKKLMLLFNGGADLPTPYAVYQPKGAASFEASLINLANPGTHDAVFGGVLPTWATETGWEFNGSTQYLLTDIVALNDGTWSLIVQFSDIAGTGGILAGSGHSPSNKDFFLQPNRSDNKAGYFSGSYILVSTGMASGNMCVAGNKGYRNGVVEAGTISNTAQAQPASKIGTANKSGITGIAGRIQAIAFYDVALTAAQVATISASMAALPTLAAPTGNVHLMNMPGRKVQHHLETYNAKLYAVAGESVTNTAKKLYAYDPATGMWATLTDLPIAEAERQSAAWKAVGTKIYFIGGYTSGAGTYHAEVLEYDPAGNSWATKTSMPTPREDFGSFVLSDKIHCVGGITTGGAVTDVHEVYDPAGDSWATLAPLPVAKLLGNFGAAAGGKGYAIGGTDTLTGYPVLSPVNTVYEYDPVGDDWTVKTPIPALGCYREVAELGGKLYVCGGASSGFYSPNITTIYEYDPALDSWDTAGSLPYAVSGAALTTYDGHIYLSGGYDGSAYRADLWRLVLA